MLVHIFEVEDFEWRLKSVWLCCLCFHQKLEFECSVKVSVHVIWAERGGHDTNHL